MSTVDRWLRARGLKLAVAKSEAVILVGRRKVRSLEFDMNETGIQTQVVVSEGTLAKEHKLDRAHEAD